MLLHPDGIEETMFAAGKGAVLDPAISFDAQWVFFSYIPDASSSGINSQRGLATGGADIYKINMATRQVVRLTQQVWTPPSGSANWSTNLLSASGANTVYLGLWRVQSGRMPAARRQTHVHLQPRRVHAQQRIYDSESAPLHHG